MPPCQFPEVVSQTNSPTKTWQSPISNTDTTALPADQTVPITCEVSGSGSPDWYLIAVTGTAWNGYYALASNFANGGTAGSGPPVDPNVPPCTFRETAVQDDTPTTKNPQNPSSGGPYPTIPRGQDIPVTCEVSGSGVSGSGSQEWYLIAVTGTEWNGHYAPVDEFRPRAIEQLHSGR